MISGINLTIEDSKFWKSNAWETPLPIHTVQRPQRTRRKRSTTTPELMLVRSLELWVDLESLLCPIRRLTALCNWGLFSALRFPPGMHSRREQ